MRKHFGIVLALMPIAAQAYDTLPACTGDQNETACVYNWVEHNALRTLTWQLAEDDFEAPTLSFSPPTGYTLRSRLPPSLIDVDQDGTRDILTFNPIGMVNGDFDIFDYDPMRNGYTYLTTLSGHSLMYDASGLLVANSRSGPGQFFQFYEIEESGLNPLFTIDVQSECTVTMGEVTLLWANNPKGLPALLRAQPDLVRNYCGIFSEAGAPTFWTDILADTGPTFIAPNSVYYCEIDTGKGRYVVNATLDLDGYSYTYGPLGGTPELVLERYRNEVDATANALYINNGAYTYMLHNAPWGLTVLQAGIETPIFDKTCDQATAFDSLAKIEPY